jgi:hypothetical protein
MVPTTPFRWDPAIAWALIIIGALIVLGALHVSVQGAVRVSK